MTGSAELEALLRLRALPGIGDVRLNSLVDRHGSARAALAAPAAELGREAARERGSPAVRERAAAALETIRRLRVAVVARGSARYPNGLTHLHDPPPVLFARGRLELLDRPAVAIVGSRACTRYGARTAARIAGALADAGVVVVSGMARGIDGAAHRAALERGTVGVLGAGIDIAYPRRHAGLHAKLARQGLLLTEFLPGEEVRPHHFPRRNRIIAALSLGVIVVEAAAKSGALITAEHAADIGREVLAVPGPIDGPRSAGANALIRDGATPVLHPRDVLAALGLEATSEAAVRGAEAGDGAGADPARDVPADLTPEQVRLWTALDHEPQHIDELATGARLSAGDALRLLLELELRGVAAQLPGGRFVRESGNPAAARG